MADDLIKAEIKGLKEVQAKMEQVVRDITGTPMLNAMRKATLIVMRDARKNAPVDRGRLRASITPEVVTQANVVQGIVGSNVVYAPFVELGTRPHTPPWTPIFEWAMRKLKGDRSGARALAASVRASIRARGTIAKRYLERALEDNAPKIFKILGNVVTTIVEK
jgi:HK97 gp10 family phage protein